MLRMDKDIAVYNNTTGIIEIMQGLFAAEKIHMHQVHEIDELLELIKENNIQLILIDLKFDGSELRNEFDFIKQVRNCTKAPVIVVSTQTSETAKIMSLNVGADDYITASDSPLVILARVKAQLRRFMELTSVCSNDFAIYRTEHIVVNDQNHTVMVDGRNVKMTPIEYKILRFLVQEQGRPLSIDHIYENIWDMKPVEAGNVIAVHIRHLREKIEKNPKDPRYIKSVWGHGYKVG